MAIVSILSSGSTKGHKPLKNVLDYCMQDAKTIKDGSKLVTGIGCMSENAYSEMMATKKQYGKLGGREYCHILQSFSPDENITPEQAHDIACEFAEQQFKGYETIVATHVDRNHIHSHIVFNSVNYETGKKYHSDNNNIQRLREASDVLCLKYGLTVLGKTKKGLRNMGTREFRAAEKGESWKINLMATINAAMKRAKTKDEFIRFMQSRGYKVTWTDSRKYITYTTPDGKRCRDNRLHLKKYTKEELENEFETRRRINELRRKRGEESYSGIESDSLRNDIRRELEEDRHDFGRAVESDVQAGNDSERPYHDRTDDGLSRAVRGYPDDARADMDSGTGKKSGVDEDGIRLTGWEAERAICYGIGQDQAGTEDRNAAVFGQTLSPVNAPMPDYNVALSGAYLVAHASNVIEEPEDSEQDENERAREIASHGDRKKKQKHDGQGPIMSM